MTSLGTDFQRQGTARRPARTLVLASGSLLMFGLASCSSPSAEIPAAAGGAVNPACRDAARDRASDAKDAGMDDDTQRQVLERVYAECADWHAKWDSHAPGTGK
jgi:hypothetical protein